MSPIKQDITEIDTFVVPAQEQGFERVFLGENCWYAVPVSLLMRTQIKYTAAYQSRRISAITHIAPVRSIEMWKDTGKSINIF